MQTNKEETTKNSRLAIGILCTVLGAMCWGASACFGEYLFANASVDTNWLISIRLVVAGGIFLIIGMIKNGMQTFAVLKNKRGIKMLAAFGIFGMFMSQYPYFTAIEHSNAGTATVLQSLATVMILIFVSIRDRKMPKCKQVISIILALIGVFLLSTGGNFKSMQISQIALFAGLLSAVGAMFYNILSGELISKYGVYSIAGLGMFCSGVLFLPIARPWEMAVEITPQLIIGLSGVVIVGTAVAFGFFLKGVSIVGPLMGGLIATLEPVSAVVFSALILGSTFTMIEITAFAMILGGVFWLSMK